MKLETALGLTVGAALLLAGGLYFMSSGPVSTRPTNYLSTPPLDLAEKMAMLTPAPEISSPAGFVNTDGRPVTLAEFRGRKVVLVDFWTYSCINCIRTLPYLRAWDEKYRDLGLEIVGVHTPEFAFEKKKENVEGAARKFGVEYSVVLDNDYATWNAFGNQYWPRKYLIDVDGFIVYDHAGEGDYEETEKAIQKALSERKSRLGLETAIPTDIAQPAGAVSVAFGQRLSPEIYFGSDRNDFLANGRAGVSGPQALTVPATVAVNRLYLGGTWSLAPEYAENATAASIVFRYRAKNVYIVASHPRGTEVELFVDGKFEKTIMIKDEELHTLIEGTDYGEHRLEIKIKEPGLQAFTFTFG
ncbi:hypothetical protein A3C96_01420 [Candidatus Uhrbacteria bacterium RIFCSPHIGHO2_02_FULL_60_10]|uniref:Thioredoxin domain-containing protein n=1 Tax=Candidatus Uhrbacteria bacterium RIFCSPHIGHO2_02_FULL_60_10 TaxID=1802392 RepID=A0A1F7U821_9BACT|nr:MAG: hypothetical protein A3C96_01420 [Candidatus Uhrbacteria bacterium RIFCSPHIGHO2_02_FULL_60_10]